MFSNGLASALLASLVVSQANALATIIDNSIIPIDESVKQHADAFVAFLIAPLVTLSSTESITARQEVPEDATPDPNRPVVTPENIFVLQCSDAGFQGECLSFGAPPGDCGMIHH